ncbi:MAG: hypothetical protein Q9167_000345 [Letrouitia subvulpina]
MSTSQGAVGQEKGGSNRPLSNDNSIFVHHAEAVWEQREPYGPPGFSGLFVSYYATLCAAFAALGGMVFGYDQGVVSVVLVMPQFLSRFPRVSDTASGAGFWKGLLTAMIELGALLGALNQGWIADKISRKYSIVIAVVIFTTGSILQTASVDYAMLIVGRLIGGVGIGMLSMVAPLYISEISPPEIRGALLVLEEFSIVAGICIAYWITYGTPIRRNKCIGRTLEQMDHVFKDLNGEEEEARRRAIEVEIMASSQQRAELTVNGVKDREAQVHT